MTLGDYVRLARTFLEVFKAPRDYLPEASQTELQELEALKKDLKVPTFGVYLFLFLTLTRFNSHIRTSLPNGRSRTTV